MASARTQLAAKRRASCRRASATISRPLIRNHINNDVAEHSVQSSSVRRCWGVGSGYSRARNDRTSFWRLRNEGHASRRGHYRTSIRQILQRRINTKTLQRCMKLHGAGFRLTLANDAARSAWGERKIAHGPGEAAEPSAYDIGLPSLREGHMTERRFLYNF